MADDALGRTEARLTKSQRRIYLYLESQPGVGSYRKIAEGVGVSPRTAFTGLLRLNELEYVLTSPGSRTRPAGHTVLKRPGGVLERDAIPREPVEKMPGGDANLHQGGGAISLVNSQGGGAIPARFSTETAPSYKEDARDTYTYTCSDSEALVGESSHPPVENPKPAQEETELVAFVESLFGERLDWDLRHRYSALPGRFGVPALTVFHFLEYKLRQKRHQRKRIYHAAALLRYAEDDLADWILAKHCAINRDLEFLGRPALPVHVRPAAVPPRKPAASEVLPPRDLTFTRQLMSYAAANARALR